MWTSRSNNHRQVSAVRLAATLVLASLSLVPAGAVSPASGSPPTPPLPPGGLYTVREIKPHVFLYLPDDVLDQDGDPEFERAGTAGFIVTPDGVIVVDTANTPFHARELLYEIRERTDAPVKYVIDTSSDGDRVLGNEVFVDLQATILSSPATEFEMRLYRADLARRLEGDWRLQARMRGIHPTPPRQTFTGSTTLRLGGEEVRLTNYSTGVAPSLGAGSPTSDTVVYLPAEKVLFLGSLFSNDYFPRLSSSLRTRDLGRWIALLHQLETSDAEVYVPGHGAPGSKQDLVRFRQFLEWLQNEVEIRIKEGKPLSEARSELEPTLENRHWHAPELAAEVIADAYRQLAASPSAAATPSSPGTSPSHH
ncbi:MAG TPA: MBL fold metallo-hydrolase [Terriglobia bacterium]|nr:MBL fold metallo-hydrolase [Terriglobia bacterium]